MATIKKHDEFLFLTDFRELQYIINTIQNTGNFIARLENNCSCELMTEILNKMINCGLKNKKFHFEVKRVYDN